MIQYKKGDLFTTPDRVIVHGCNSHGIMGSGVAKRVKELYPEAYEKYRDYCKEMDLRQGKRYILGKVIAAMSNNMLILNCITQMDYGNDGEKYVSYDAIDTSMMTIARKHDLDNISMPKIGAGLGGGNWNVIKEIINHRLKDKIVTVWEL